MSGVPPAAPYDLVTARATADGEVTVETSPETLTREEAERRLLARAWPRGWVTEALAHPQEAIDGLDLPRHSPEWHILRAHVAWLDAQEDDPPEPDRTPELSDERIDLLMSDVVAIAGTNGTAEQKRAAVRGVLTAARLGVSRDVRES